MKALMLILSSVLFFGLSASADWGDAQDIQDQWRGGGSAYGGSGNPYSGGYDGGFYNPKHLNYRHDRSHRGHSHWHR